LSEGCLLSDDGIEDGDGLVVAAREGGGSRAGRIVRRGGTWCEAPAEPGEHAGVERLDICPPVA
jgi:hypothetical protein